MITFSAFEGRYGPVPAFAPVKAEVPVVKATVECTVYDSKDTLIAQYDARVLPRKGEDIELGGNTYKVTRVYHCLERERIVLYCKKRGMW